MVDISQLEEHTLYKVFVKCSENNVEHISILFMGFKTGSYCMVYNNSYDAPIPVRQIYSLTIIEKLTNLKEL